jgi:excisionase family DNA binding protein
MTTAGVGWRRPGLPGPAAGLPPAGGSRPGPRPTREDGAAPLAMVVEHLATAVRNHRRRLRRDGLAEPGLLAELEAICTFAAQCGTWRPELARLEAPGHAAVMDAARPVERMLFTYRQAAETLEIGERTVRKLVREGRLPAVRIGGAVRIRRTDLDAYVAGLDRCRSPLEATGAGSPGDELEH